MFTRKKAPLAAAVAAAVVGLAGCLGGGGGDAAHTEGWMVDGYVVNGTVFCDTNGNGVLDAGEVSTKTDANGHFDFGAQVCLTPLGGYGGQNKDTGFNFTGRMTAPVNSAYLTPLTTLMASAGLSKDDLAKLLQLQADPTQKDPGQDVALMKTTLSVQQLVAQMAATLQAANPQLKLEDLYAQVAAALANVLKGAKDPLISSTGTLNLDLLVEAYKAAGTKLGLTISANDAKAVASAAKSQAEEFLALSKSEDLVAKAKQLQDPKNTDIKIDPAAGTKFFALDADTVTVDSQAVTLSQLQSANGVALNTFDKVSFKLNVTSVPTVGTSALALELVEQGGEGRVMRVALDKANLSLTSGKLGLSIPTDAKVYLYGLKANDKEVSYGGPLGAAKKPLAFTGDNVLTIDYSAIVNRVREASDSTNEPTLASFLAVKGKFKLTAVISNFNLRKANGDALPLTTLKATASSPAVYGPTISGLITVN